MALGALEVILVSLAVFRCGMVRAQESNFRLFGGLGREAEVEEYRGLSDAERLEFAARTGEAVIIRITGESQIATAQEASSVSIDCLPWLQQFPEGSIQWFRLQLDEFGNPSPPDAMFTPLFPGTDSVQTVGGESDRWVNITGIVIDQGARDPDGAIYKCEVCANRGTRSESCNAANYTNLVIGAPPRFSTQSRNHCIDPGDEFILECAIIEHEAPTPVPTPVRTWTKDGVVLYSTEIRQFPEVDDFVMDNPIFTPGILDPDVLYTPQDGSILYRTTFVNVTAPALLAMAGFTPAEARAELLRFALGIWTCTTSNNLGNASINYVIRRCGPPVIPDCSMSEPNGVVLPDSGAVLNPGCNVCIQEGDSVTLDCTVISGDPPVTYVWTNGTEDVVLAGTPKLTVTMPGTYSCNVTNMNELERTDMVASVLFFCCPMSITDLPLIGRVEWPTTHSGRYPESRTCPGVTEKVILIRRFCNTNGVWSEPDYENCLQAIVDRDFDDISNRLNKTNISAVEVMELVSDLSDTVGNAAEEDVGQSLTALEVVNEALRTVRRFLEENEGFAEPDADGEVIEQVVEVLDGISDWPEDVVQERSSNIVESFEGIATSLVNQSNMTDLTFVTEDVIFRGERRNAEELMQNGWFVSFTAEGVSSSSLFEHISKEDRSTISLPPSLYKTLRMTKSDDLIGQFFTSYSDAVLFPIADTDVSNLTTMVIGSSVLAANVLSHQPIRDLAEPITLEFKVQNLKDALSVSCVSWDFRAAGGRGNWTTSGCKVVKSDEDTNTTACQCNHLTPFSVVIEICRRVGTCPDRNENFQQALDILFYIGASISSLCLIATIITVSVLLLVKSRSSKDRERQSAIQFKFYIQLSLALLLLYIAFMVGINRTERFAVCVLFSSLIHYFSLTSVMWMTASCGFIFWIMVVDPFAKARFNNIHMLIITIVCWALPLLPVVIPLAISRDHMVGYNTTGEERQLEYCFTGPTVIFFSAFIGPLLLLLALNTVMYISITYVQLRYICCTRKKRIIAQSDDKNGTKNSVVENFLTALKLLCIFCMFGLGWLFGAFGITGELAYISSTLFVVFTSLQGLFIFVFLCILSKDALMLYRRFCCKYSATFQTSYDSQSTKTSTLAGKNGSREDKGDTLKSALAQELSVKVKENEYELDNVDAETSTFKPPQA